MISKNGRSPMRGAGTVSVLSTVAVMVLVASLTQVPGRSSIQTPISANAMILNAADDQNGPPDANGGPQGGGPQGRAGRGPRRPPLSRIPESLLQAELNLTSDQATKITAIQKALPARTTPPPPPSSDEANPPAPGANDDARNLERDAAQKISAILTDDQKANLPNVYKLMGALRVAGIPPEVVSDLKLTSDQTTQLKALAPSTSASEAQGDRRAMHEKAMAILTDAQKQTVEEYRAQHPHQGPPPPDAGAAPEGGMGPGGPPAPGE